MFRLSSRHGIYVNSSSGSGRYPGSSSDSGSEQNIPSPPSSHFQITFYPAKSRSGRKYKLEGRLGNRRFWLLTWLHSVCTCELLLNNASTIKNPLSYKHSFGLLPGPHNCWKMPFAYVSAVSKMGIVFQYRDNPFWTLVLVALLKIRLGPWPPSG